MSNPTIQIFVKMHTGLTRTLEVLPSDTADLVQQRLRDKVGCQTLPCRFVYQGKELKGTDTLADKGVTAGSTLHHSLPPPSSKESADREVIPLLHNHLQKIITDLGERHFVFVSVGSCDMGSEGEASIVRQQCPTAVLDFCRHRDWRLTIILIDPEFPGTKPQINTVKSQHWISEPVYQWLDGKVLQYINMVHQTASVFMYSTGIQEYVWGRGIVDPRKIHGYQLMSMFVGTARARQLRNVCLVMGNFFGKTPHPSEYATYGDETVLTGCGIKPNP